MNKLTVTKAIKMLQNKEISATELTQSCINAIESAEPKINALVTKCTQEALTKAKEIDNKRAKGEKLGALAGIPGIIKDNICTKGVLSTASSKMLYNYKPVYNATVIDKLNNEDYILIGKANLDEFAMGSSTETSYFGVTANPYDTTRVSGGSSGGSAASVSANEALFSLGSDTGGSVRQPAAFCGVVGLKPTYGTVSRYGLMAFASSLDQIGPITKCVEDSALLLNIISGNDTKDSTSAIMDYGQYGIDMKQDIKGIKVGIPKEYSEQKMSEDAKQAFLDSIKTFESMGAIIEETTLPTFDYALSAYYVIASAEASSNLARFDGIRYGYRADNYENLKEMYKKTRSEGFGDEVKRRIMLGNYVLSSGYYDAFYLKALKARTLIKQDFDNLFSKYDILLSPTTPGPAFKTGEITDPLEMYLADLFTVPVNIAGLTAINVPCALSKEGLPISAQIIAKAFDENTMFKAAYNFEQAVKYNHQPKM